jgi:hypothetical protein
MTRVFVLLALLATAIASAAQGAVGPVDFGPSEPLQKRALSPSPGANAVRQAAIGRGKTTIDSGDPKSELWSETVEISAGNLVNTQMLWDPTAKILYAFAHNTLRCTHGKTVDGDILIGLYGKRNFLDKAPGSGWWVVDLQQGECEAPLAGLYGCKFGPRGEALACGRAEVDPRINDLAIVEATQF